MDFEFIDENEIEAVKRGRKSTVPPELIQALASMPKGKALKVREYALDPKSDEYKNDKASVSAMIRSAGLQAGVKVAISFSPEGIPQIVIKTPKVKAKG